MTRNHGQEAWRFCNRLQISLVGLVTLAHWAIENSLHWVLDVTFNEDKCRSRTGHGPANMAVVRHFAFNLREASTTSDPRSCAASEPPETTNTSNKSYNHQSVNSDSKPWTIAAQI